MIWAFVDPWAGDAVIGLHVLERLQARGFATYQAQHSEHTDVLCRQLDDFLNRRVDAIIIQAIPSQLQHPDVVERLAQFPAVVAVTRDGGSLPVSLPYDPIRVGTKKPGAGRAFKKVDQ